MEKSFCHFIGELPASFRVFKKHCIGNGLDNGLKLFVGVKNPFMGHLGLSVGFELIQGTGKITAHLLLKNFGVSPGRGHVGHLQKDHCTCRSGFHRTASTEVTPKSWSFCNIVEDFMGRWRTSRKHNEIRLPSVAREKHLGKGILPPLQRVILHATVIGRFPYRHDRSMSRMCGIYRDGHHQIRFQTNNVFRNISEPFTRIEMLDNMFLHDWSPLVIPTHLHCPLDGNNYARIVTRNISDQTDSNMGKYHGRIRDFLRPCPASAGTVLFD